MRSRRAVRATQLALLLGGLGAWEAASARRILDPFFFSAPSAIARQIAAWASSPAILRDLGITLTETVLSFVLGTLGGVVMGVWLGRSPFAAAVLQPFVKVMNAIPRILLGPIFVLWLGLGLASKVALGFTMVFFVSFFNVLQGIREVSPVVLANARLLRASEGALLRHVYLPSATSWILSSLRVAVGMAVMGSVVAEYLGSSAGIGHVIAQAEGVMDATGVFAGLALLSTFVVALDRGVDALERRVLVWRPQAQGQEEMS